MIKRTINDLGTKLWSKNGALHRLDGPAVVYADGNKRWFLNDTEYTHDEFILLQFSKGKIINE